MPARDQQGSLCRDRILSAKRFWQLLGAAFTREKDGGQAVSLTKAAFALTFIASFVMWVATGGDIPDSMLSFLMGSAGLHAVKSGIESFGGRR